MLVENYSTAGLHKLWQPSSLAARKWRENENMKRKWRGNWERMRKWRDIRSLHFLIVFLFSPSLSISYIKNCLTLSQNVKHGTFVANVKKNLTYALWENYSGSNSLWESFASCNIGSNIVYAPPLSPNHWLLISYLTLSGDQEVILVPLIWTTGHVKDKWWTSVYIKSSQQRRAESNWGSKKDKLRFPKWKQNSNFANSHKLIGFYFPPDISSSKFLRDRGPITGPKQDI